MIIFNNFLISWQKQLHTFNVLFIDMLLCPTSFVGNYILNVIFNKWINKLIWQFIVRNNSDNRLISATINLKNTNLSQCCPRNGKHNGFGRKHFCRRVVKPLFCYIFTWRSYSKTIDFSRVNPRNFSIPIFCFITAWSSPQYTLANISKFFVLPIVGHRAAERLEVHEPRLENGLCHLL